MLRLGHLWTSLSESP